MPSFLAPCNDYLILASADFHLEEFTNPQAYGISRREAARHLNQHPIRLHEVASACAGGTESPSRVTEHHVQRQPDNGGRTCEITVAIVVLMVGQNGIVNACAA